MDKQDIKEKIYSRIDELPTLPAVIPRLLALIRDNKSSADDITEAISYDPALTAKVLKVANSAYYGFPQQISELGRAVTLMGFNMIQSLALSLGVIKTITSTGESRSFSHEGFWLHSLAVATIIRELGRKHVPLDDGTEYRFVTGLLHDIGKLVLDLYFHDDFVAVLKSIEGDEYAKLHVAEQVIIGIDHCEISAMLLRRWKFPEKIVQPVEYLHRADVPDEVNRTDIALLKVSNTIAQEMDIGREGNEYPNPLRVEDLELLNTSEDGLEPVRTHAARIKAEVTAFYSAMM